MGQTRKGVMSATEVIQVVRDLTIIFFAMAGMLLMLVAGVVLLVLYRKVSPTLDSARDTARRTQEATTEISEKFIKPMVNASTLAYTSGRVLGFIAGITQGKGDRKNGK
jgi:hypothetical protein